MQITMFSPTFMSILTLAAMMCTVTCFPGTLLNIACTKVRFGRKPHNFSEIA